MRILPSEKILQYIWQHRYFDQPSLQTTLGETINIIHPGHKSPDEGPDFLNARIRIGTIEWAGSIEMHVKSSGWDAHKHNNHGAYQNVILHVVFEDDKAILRNDDTSIPTLVLASHISPQLVERCRTLLDNMSAIPCQNSIASMDKIVVLSMLDKAFGQRLQRKANEALDLLAENNNDWEETAYQLIAGNFGFKVNIEPFLKLAKMLPLKVLLKHTSDIHQIEALLFGQAGFLEDEAGDEYYLSLQKEYRFLSHKYNLKNKKLQIHEWKFLRLRPANFPTIRISQFATLIYNTKSLFSHIIGTESIGEIKKLFDIDQSDYWKKHYLFGKSTAGYVSGLGGQACDNLLINSVCVLLASYSIQKDAAEYTERAISLLETIPTEQNKITKTWNLLGIVAKNAFDSQALIELFNNFCTRKECLGCNIGHSIISRK